LTSQNNPHPSIKEFLSIIFATIALVGVLYISFWDSAGEAPSGSSANIKPNSSPPQVAEPLVIPTPSERQDDSSGAPPTLPPCDTDQRAIEVQDEARAKCRQWSIENCTRKFPYYATKSMVPYEECKKKGNDCFLGVVRELGCSNHRFFGVQLLESK